jgi:hypothetical protein
MNLSITGCLHTGSSASLETDGIARHSVYCLAVGSMTGVLFSAKIGIFILHVVRLQVLTVASMKMTGLWNMESCTLVEVD